MEHAKFKTIVIESMKTISEVDVRDRYENTSLEIRLYGNYTVITASTTMYASSSIWKHQLIKTRKWPAISLKTRNSVRTESSVISTRKFSLPGSDTPRLRYIKCFVKKWNEITTLLRARIHLHRRNAIRVLFYFVFIRALHDFVRLRWCLLLRIRVNNRNSVTTNVER